MIYCPDSVAVCEEMLPDNVDLWWVDRPALNAEVLLNRFGGYLSYDERQRLVSHKTPKGEYQFLLTRIVLRTLLSRYHPGVRPEEWQFGRSGSGRPMVIGPVHSLDFNLSHSGDHLVLAFSRSGRLGVDVEYLQRQMNYSKVAQRYFHPDECRTLFTLPVHQQRQHFLSLWTLKEACVKATGQGLAKAMRAFNFEMCGQSGLRCAHFHQDRFNWRAWSGELDACRLSVVWRSAAAKPAAPIPVLRSFRCLLSKTGVPEGADQTFTAERLDWQPDLQY